MDTIKQDQLRRDFVSFADSKPQKINRPLKADGAAGTIAVALLRGDRLSVQDTVRLLAARGITSNDTARRMREALAWLTKQGVSVSKQLRVHADAPDFHVWYIPRTNAHHQTLTKMIKGRYNA